MFLHGLETLKNVVEKRNDCTLTVVSRYGSIRDTAEKLGIHAVDSPDSEKGVSYTIRAGISALKMEEGDYLLFVVADQPWLTAGSVEKLLNLADGKTVCASLCYGGKPGNPALFSASLVPELLALEGDKGGRSVLKRHACVFVSAESAKELEDLDVP